MSSASPLPGGVARRAVAQGLAAGERRASVSGADAALALVHEPLSRVEQALSELVRSDVRALSHIADYLAGAGGKRLRPALGALGSLALGLEPPIDLLAAGELVHLGSLLHDDVVDEAALRRGQPAAHIPYGNAASVLAGDFCTSRALEVALLQGGFEAGLALARTVAEMSAGEVLQLQRAGRQDTTRAQYFEIVDRKSASLIAWCVSAPALSADDTDAAQILATYGRHLGRAYQIVDDVLDYEPRTGKLPGADLRERKITLPLLFALEQMPDLRAQVFEQTCDDAAISALVARIRASDALPRALSEARACVDRATAALGALRASEAREALVALGAHIVERTA